MNKILNIIDALAYASFGAAVLASLAFLGIVLAGLL